MNRSRIHRLKYDPAYTGHLEDFPWLLHGPQGLEHFQFLHDMYYRLLKRREKGGGIAAADLGALGGEGALDASTRAQLEAWLRDFRNGDDLWIAVAGEEALDAE